MVLNNYKVIFVLLIALFASIYIVFGFYSNSDTGEDNHLQLVINENPVLGAYTSKTASKSILEAQQGDSYYVAFVDYGSGLGITAAKCYQVDENNTVRFIQGNQFPPFDDLLVTKIDPVTCLPEFTETPKGF